MNYISKEQYEYALNRVEELLPTVDDNIELSVLSEVVIAYEKEHYPIGKPSL